MNEITAAGIPKTPFDTGNSNLPCRSKTQVDVVGPEDSNEKRFNPDDTFGRGFRHWQSNKNKPEIDRYKRRSLMRDPHPDMA